MKQGSGDGVFSGRTPLVSICVPTYNRADYIGECLDSIASQTYKNVEVLLSDNASTDGTVRVLRRYSEKYGYRIHVNPKNIGWENFNQLIRMASGEYIAIYHSDDVYESTIVEECVKVLNEDPEIALVGTMGYHIDAGGKRFGEMKLNRKIRKLGTLKYTFDQALTGVTSRWWFFVTPSIMVRKRVYEEVGGFETQTGKYRSVFDYEMWLRIANRYPVAVIDKKLMNFRSHSGSGTAETRRNMELPGIVPVLQEYQHLARDPRTRMLCERCIDANYLQFGRRQNYRGDYGSSEETLRNVRLLRHLPEKLLISFCNRLGISIKNRKPA